MLTSFPNADNFKVASELFIATWKVWFKRFGREPDIWRHGKMPLGESQQTLARLVADGDRFSLEVMSRMLVPWAYRDQGQLDEGLHEQLRALISHTHIDDEDGQSVAAAALTEEALDEWDALTFVTQDQYLSYAEARIQADIESPSDEDCILDDRGVVLIGEDTYPPIVPAPDAPDAEFVRALVRWIDDAPYQPMYCREAAGEAVAGWHDRMLAFFWPKPRIGLPLYHASLDPLLYRANELARTLDAGGSWDSQWRDMAVKTAQEIFQVAGLPQRQVTLDNVEAVMRAALTADPDARAKMNSGWTYLASLCTAHLEGQPGRVPMISWNSRSSASVLSRLDFLLTEAGVTELGDRFPDLGSIPGAGGTRPREFSLDWPTGYRSWRSQVAASHLALAICDILNNERKPNGERRYRSMPMVQGSKGPWTVRGVQLVLFGDGY